MDKILRELYHGAIHPEEAYRPMSEEHQRLQKVWEYKKEVLMERMEEDAPALCAEMNQLMEQAALLEAMGMEECYIQGMKMGARLALGLLDNAKE